MVILEKRDAETAANEQAREIDDDGQQLDEPELGRREMRGVDRNQNQRGQAAHDLAHAIDPRVPYDGRSFAGLGSQTPSIGCSGASNRRRCAKPRQPDG